MDKISPSKLAGFSFIICAVVAGFSRGMAGGALEGAGDWIPFIIFILVVSAIASAVVWLFSTICLKTDSDITGRECGN